MSDNLYFPSGQVVSGDIMRGLFYEWPQAVRQFQLVQQRDHSLTLRCVPGDDPQAAAIMRRVAAGLEETVRREVPVRLEIVDVIPHDRGKTRFILRAEDAPVPPQPRPGNAAGTQSTTTSRTLPLSTS